jgi:hypothetical protein
LLSCYMGGQRNNTNNQNSDIPKAERIPRSLWTVNGASVNDHMTFRKRKEVSHRLHVILNEKTRLKGLRILGKLTGVNRKRN